MSEKILLLDGHSMANRAFYGVPLLTNSRGVYTNALFGFFNIFWKVIEQEKPDRVGVAFDMHAPTFRHKLFPGYKGTRHAMPEELRAQIPLIQQMLEQAGIPLFMHEGYEADDLLGTLSCRYAGKGDAVVILSGDRDLLQLVSDRVTVLIPKTKKGGTELEIYHEAEVLDKYGVSPQGYLQMKALMGDASDNIPGVPAVGEKTAAKLVQQYGTVEELLAHCDEVMPLRIRQNLMDYADQARLSLTLATIETNADPMEKFIGEPVRLREDTFAGTGFIQLLKEYELKSLLQRVLPKTAAAEPAVAAAPVAAAPGAAMQLSIEGWEEEAKPTPPETTECRIADRKDWQSFLTGLAESRRLILELFEGEGLVVGDGRRYAWIETGAELSLETIGEDLRPYLESEKLAKVTFDSKRLHRAWLPLGIRIRNITLDGMIAAYLLNPTKSAYSPDELSGAYLGELAPSEEEVLGTGARKLTLSQLPVEHRVSYTTGIGRILERVEEPMLRELEARGMTALYREIELPLARVLAHMEFWGVRVETTVLEAFGHFLQGEIASLQQEIYQLAGTEFNIQSPKQLGEVLFERLQLPAGKKTKTGYSTSAEILEKLQPEHPIVGKILLYRQMTKLQSTYVEGMGAFIHPEDGKIHTCFQQTVTATGRLSSTDPNLQNIPIRMELGRQLRKAFVPTDGEYLFMDADYSQIELRLLAHMSQDEAMIQAFMTHQDIHRITASQVLHIPPEEVTPAQRSSAKAVNFGIIYGISAFALGNDLHITQKEAAGYIRSYLAQYPRVEAFLNGCVEQAKEQGYGVTLFGRRRAIDELKASNFMQRSFGERVAKNMPIQGSAADIIKIAMVRVFERMEREGLRSRLLLQVHDELLIEVYRPEEAAMRRILEEEMSGAAQLAVPLEIDIHTGENWYEAK